MGEKGWVAAKHALCSLACVLTGLVVAACFACCLSCRAVINPTELRVALAEHTPFKCQEMNDANELLDTIYECFAQSQVGQCIGWTVQVAGYHLLYTLYGVLETILECIAQHR